MDSDEDLTVSCAMYLAEWGLSETTISNFEENKISVKLLDCIEEAELKELIPSLKERILYKRGMKKLQTIIHETCSDDTVSINSSDDTVSINSDFSAPSPTNSTTSTSINKLPPTKENSSYTRKYLLLCPYFVENLSRLSADLMQEIKIKTKSAHQRQKKQSITNRPSWSHETV
ncbi:uncharacterized protein LOC125233664 isoform X3 [Leguminivora glycinivorella]|uniref:uncharacterized protein LOC125233664 isoform X3 n=1 Tax=Leguminivora glycinivorella TaxID=1035111 RepID=UPI002010A975|nr:uncharacterized protein LOC125233664 isoform X3 [Leguminivora glycinivorella]